MCTNEEQEWKYNGALDSVLSGLDIRDTQIIAKGIQNVLKNQHWLLALTKEHIIEGI